MARQPRQRPLTPGERAIAAEVFAGALDLAPITVAHGGLYAAGASRTVGNGIHLQGLHFTVADDPTCLALAPSSVPTLVHELVHVWQYQHGGIAYAVSSLGAQLRGWIATGSRGAAYEFRPLLAAGVPWPRWNAEQQAELVETWFVVGERVRRGGASAEDLAFLDEVAPMLAELRAGRGAPGAR